jgi:uncharacterized protein (DUF433 family)
MTAESTAIYGGRDPVECPAYTKTDAARMTGVPISTVRNWVLGRSEDSGQGRVGFEPAIRLDDPTNEFLSFRNLVELHVLAAIRRDYQLKLPVVRRATQFLRDKFRIAHPLATVQMLTDGRDLLIKQGLEILNTSRGGQIEMKWISACLERIEYDRDGKLQKLFPFTTTDPSRDFKAVVIDPRSQFGRPCLRDVGVPTEVIMSRFAAGERIEELAGDFGIEAKLIEEAIRFEQPGRAA